MHAVLIVTGGGVKREGQLGRRGSGKFSGAKEADRGTPSRRTRIARMHMRIFTNQTSTPSKNLARVIKCKKAPVIFERSERPARNARFFPAKKRAHMPGRFFAALKNDGSLSARADRLGFSKVSIRNPQWIDFGQDAIPLRYRNCPRVGLIVVIVSPDMMGSDARTF